MQSVTAEEIARTVLAVLVLIIPTTLVLRATGVPQRWAPALAVLRGMLQLAVLSIILTGVITDARLVALALVVMFAAAALTSARRLGTVRAHLPLVVAGMGTGIVVTLVVVFATGAIELSARYALAVGGIIIGNAMSTSTLAGRRLLQAADDRWDEIEGWLALGATPRQATLPISRHALHEALVPATDQTRTTGLVTLPGAFVGAIFGGISPLEAGRFQIVVLAGIMATAALTSAVVSLGLAPRLCRGDAALRSPSARPR
ncbi:ABC transporter permease [Brachybacterium halotolerans subsp. kimchii]|uniref:ABC transporter permease n=1 Tax=Brachybacterium halotolerans TaxID=2795215 RepID=UPI001E3298B9|nr:ABC transporter permease [Brachybacterium halotolerans]UEJ83827.1 ABC transporter permease [Brachybacterium halotolerans subsp. kimchii]